MIETDVQTMPPSPKGGEACSPDEGRLLTGCLDVARRQPHSPAVADKQELWSYERLFAEASAVATGLARRGLTPGDRVAVTGAKTAATIAAVLGVLYAGGVVVPLDITLPDGRRRRLIDRARPALTLDGLDVAGPAGGTGGEKAALPSGTLPGETVHPGDPAYVFFTSGTTGRPQGVIGSHSALGHFVTWEAEALGFGPRDRVAQLAGLSFDAMLKDLFPTFLGGGLLLLSSERPYEDPEGLLDWLDREAVTVVQTVPSAAAALVEAGERRPVTLSSLRLLCLAGEPLTGALVRRWREAFPGCPAEVVNLYGPTETTILKSWYRVPVEVGEGVLPVGRALPGTELLVVSAEGRRCGTGEPGEVWIRTPFRTLGYLDATPEEAARFVPNPFVEQAAADDVLYRTGDVGRFEPDGVLTVLGRLDDQVKVNGVRVDPAEVRSVLLEHPLVAEAAVLPAPTPAGMSLRGFVVPRPGAQLDPGGVRDFLHARLPRAMVPGHLETIGVLPLTANGKLDRRRLLDQTSAPTPQPAPASLSTPTQQLVAQLWEEILGRDRIGPHDDFFALGGHSLLATLLVARLRARTGIQVPLRWLFESPTVAGLSALLEERERGTPPGGGEELVRLSRGARHVVCLPPVSGSPAAYRGLAAALEGKATVWGLTADHRSLGQAGITPLSRHYDELLRQVLPDGVVPRLVGWSIGGLIAYELAQQRRASGIGGPPPILLDTYAPGSRIYRSRPSSPISWARWFVDDALAAHGATDRSGGLDEGLRPEEIADAVARLLDEAGLASGGLEGDEVGRRLEIFERLHRAAADYRPGSMVQRVVLLSAARQPRRPGVLEDLGWRAVVGDAVEVEVVDADHYGILRSPALERIVARLEEPW